MAHMRFSPNGTATTVKRKRRSTLRVCKYGERRGKDRRCPENPATRRRRILKYKNKQSV